MLKYSDLDQDQVDAITRLFEHDETLLVGSMGCGKTVVSATAAYELIEGGVIQKILITAPLTPCETAWRAVFEQWDHLTDLKVSYILGDEKERLEALKVDADFYIINHENLVWLSKQKIQFDAIIIDEISKFRKPGGSQFKALKKLRKNAVWCCGLTGTPVSEDWVGLYGMALLIDKGEALGKSKERYLLEYFFATDFEQRNWIPRPGQIELIAEKIEGLCHVMPDYTHTLPALSVEPEFIGLPDDAMAVYKTMRKDMVLEMGTDGIEAVNAAVLVGKLQQIAHGFIYQEEGEPIELHKWKIYAIKNMVYELKSPVVIVYQFKQELKWLKHSYPDAPVLGAGVSSTKKKEAVKDFGAGEVPVLLMHPKSAGHGTDGLQNNCHEMIFTGQLWSRDLLDQTIARLWRRGQKHPVRVRIITAEKTVDTLIAARVEDKAENMVAFLEHMRA